MPQPCHPPFFPRYPDILVLFISVFFSVFFSAFFTLFSDSHA